MRDDFLTADWARHHGHVTTTIRNAFATLLASLETLYRHQFDAPWRHEGIARR